MSKNYNIVLLPGDGIGPEVINEAIKVLNAVSKKFDFSFSFDSQLVGGAAIDVVNNPMPIMLLKFARILTLFFLEQLAELNGII